MLTTNHLKRKLQEGQSVVGLFCSIPSPLMVEMIAHADFDFVIIDTEHVLVNPETLENMIRAAEAAQITPLVRVASSAASEILPILDAGAQGIVVPHVQTPAMVQQMVQACRYFPEGERSLNGGRPAGFGRFNLTEYIQQANQEVMAIALIEDRQAIDNLEAIVSVPGLDMVLEGAADLSQSYGVPWQTRSPVVQQAIEKIYQVCQQVKVPFCAIPRATEDFQRWTQNGVQAFVLGDDRGLAYRAMRDFRQSIQPSIPPIP